MSNPRKIEPAIKNFHKSQNHLDFRDAMRGYLGLPRRQLSADKKLRDYTVTKSRKSNGSLNKSAHTNSPVSTGKISLYQQYINAEE